MRDLSATLLAAQQAGGTPVVKVEVSEYGHPTEEMVGMAGALTLGKLSTNDRSVILRPSGAGNATALSDYPAAGSNWEKVDEENHDDDLTYVYYAPLAHKVDFYALENPSDELGVISSVVVVFRVKGTAGTAEAIPKLYLDGNTTTGTTVDLHTINDRQIIYYTFTEALEKPGGGKWEWDDIDDLEVGISLQAARCTQLYVIVYCHAAGQHGSCVASDGSLNSVMGGYDYRLYHQRVTTPSSSSDYTSWTYIDDLLDNTACAIASNPAEDELIMVTTLGMKTSTDKGATWGDWENAAYFADAMNNSISIAFKSNGDCAVAWGEDAGVGDYYVYLRRRVGGEWQDEVSTQVYNNALATGAGIKSLAMYYGSDWNILVLGSPTEEDNGGTLYGVRRLVYGDGGDVPAQTWLPPADVAFTATQIVTQEAHNLDLITWRSPPTKKVGDYIGPYLQGMHREMVPIEERTDEATRLYMRGAMLGTYFEDHPDETDWCECIYVCDTPSGVFMALYRNSESHFYRLHPAYDFRDGIFSTAHAIDIGGTYGIALCCDDDYIYATQPGEVWRIPASIFWSSPTAGTGEGDSTTLPASDIKYLEETIDGGGEGGLDLILDNSDGYYATLGAGALVNMNLGSMVTLSVGYNTGSEETSETGEYFIESYTHTRIPGQNLLHVHCVDTWGLLQRYTFPVQIEWNVYDEDYTVYEMIELVMQSIGGTLTYDSRSTLITSLYPAVSYQSGGNAADLLRQLLRYVSDVIKFKGLEGTIVYPQDSDDAVYKYKFPS